MVTLIIVDFQNDFCLESGALYVKGATNAMWNIEALLESGDISRVIFTADWHMWKHPSFEEQGGPWPMHCVQYSTGAAISELLLSACRNNDIPHEVVTKGLYKEQYGALKDFHIDEDGDMCFDNASNSYWIDELEEMPSRTPIANGNLQARCRMMYLYDLAGLKQGLVMSTDNQTEYQLGFWTIHGDVGDFDPIQDLWKTEVYELAKWLEYKYGHDSVTASTADESTFNIQAMKAMQASAALTPTDGLGISNSDLDQIGAKSYAEVDDILQTLIPICEWRPELGTIQMNLDRLYDKYGQEVVDKVWNRHTASEFKRKKSPIYIEREEYAS